MITAGGQEFTYLPVSLVGGEGSSPLRVVVTIPRAGDLRASDRVEVRVLARRVGEVDWVDLASDPVSLDPDVDGDEVEFDLKYSTTEVDGANTFDVYVGFASAQAADWNA